MSATKGKGTSTQQSSDGVSGVCSERGGGGGGGGGKSEFDRLCVALDAYTWFRGLLGREDMKTLLKEEGEFVVRVSEIQKSKRFVLSVVDGGAPKHFIIQEGDEGYYIVSGTFFKAIPELVDYYVKSKHSLNPPGRPTVTLVRPVPITSWELKHDQIQLGSVLGRGAFGEVRRGVLTTRDGQKQEVAVKTCKKRNIGKEEQNKFLREARLIRNYHHPNIVKLVGVCADHDPLMIVLEFAPNGSLDSYLKENGKKVPQPQRVQFCLDAARGMAYLERHGVIHRDLAARNCLLGARKELKITDFGLSRDAKVYSLSTDRKIPMKWSSPETLRNGKYMSASDVWSYGILLWEIFSNAGEPYPGMSNRDVHRKVLKDKYRMPPPPGTPPFVAELMAGCWKENPKERPKFQSIVTIMEKHGPSEGAARRARTNSL